MSFWFADAKLLIAGDTLFRRGIGRTDLWGGDYASIERSIRQRLYALDEDATVVTGHGPDTRLGDEMRKTPSCVPDVPSRWFCRTVPILAHGRW